MKSNMPGFTAEAALNRRKGAYQGAAKERRTGGIVPQWCMAAPGGRTACCECYLGWCYCRILPHVLE
jgi:hypothetical protein